jgi:ribosomal protein S18 acetylase RimI-like enzyme
MQHQTDDVTLTRHGPDAARALGDAMADLYVRGYLGTHNEGDPFHGTAKFLDRLEGYARAPGFTLITADAPGAGLVGFAFGYVLPPNARWWNGLLDPVPDGFTTETGDRTFAVNEINVANEWRGRGLATRMHAELVAARPEPRFTLLVEPDSEANARRLYLSWGYEMVARLQPYPDSPIYDALILATPAG